MTLVTNRFSNYLPYTKVNERVGKSADKKTPSLENWQAHSGVILNDTLGITKTLSVPLFAYGIYTIFREGTFAAGLAYFVPWCLLDLLQGITHKSLSNSKMIRNK